jgi:hypothetical protein
VYHGPWADTVPLVVEAARVARTLKRATRLGLMVGVALCLVVPAYLVSETPAPQDSAWVIAYAVTVGSGLRYAVLVARGRSRLYELMVWLFV